MSSETDTIEDPDPEIFIAPEERRTDRFLLRSYPAGDGPSLCVAAAASYAHLAPWMPWARADRTEEESELLARHMRARYLLSTDFTLAIRSPDDRRLIGGCGYHLREDPLSSRNAEIGLWIHGEGAGRCLGSAVLRELVDWGFTEWPWTRLSWRCDPRNAASRRVAERSGSARRGSSAPISGGWTA